MKIKLSCYVLLIMLAILISAGWVSTAYAAGTEAGTVIQNVATVNYKDDNLNALPSVSSDPTTARTTVAQVYGVDVLPNTGSGAALAGETITYPVTITNTGNGNDTIDLTANSSNGYTANIYYDANVDGVLQQSEIDAGTITNTGQLPADGTYSIIATVDVPADATDGTTDTLTVTATSQTDGTVTDTGTYTTTVSAAVLDVQKTQDVNNPKPGDTITYTITYTNSGTVASTNSVVLTDPIPSDATFVTGSITIDGNSKTDASGDDEAEFSSNIVTANIGDVAPGGSGTLGFKVKVNDGVAAGTNIVNTVTANYEDPAGNPQTPVLANTPPAAVAQSASVDIEQSASKFADPGDQVVYGFSVTNTGNDYDLFNGQIVSSIGLTWGFYVDANANGVFDNGDSPGTDSDGDGAPDTGTLAPGETKYYLAIATIPAGTSDQTVDTTTLTAISDFDNTVTDSITLSTTVTAPSLTITKAVSPTGDQPPGTELTYTITVNNTGTGNAQNVIVTDSIPSFTNYVSNSVTVQGIAKTDDIDGDHVSVVGGVVKVQIGTMGPGGSRTITFKVNIK